MRQINGNTILIWGIIKDSLIVMLLFSLFAFIDLRTAFSVFFVCISLLLTRRMILYLNPGFIKGHKIYFRGKVLKMPDGVDIFDLGNNSSIDNLYAYAEVIRNILAAPKIIIIRFINKSRMSLLELEKLNRIINRLKVHKIYIIFSDVNVTIQNQFRQHGITDLIREENIFYFIKEALKRADDVAKRN
jgi:hypothetical protein